MTFTNRPVIRISAGHRCSVVAFVSPVPVPEVGKGDCLLRTLRTIYLPDSRCCVFSGPPHLSFPHRFTATSY